MTRWLVTTLGVCLCLAGPAWSQGMDRSVMGPSTSIFPAPSLQGSVAATGPRWPSAQSRGEKILRQIEQGTLAAGDFATYAPVGSAVDALKDAALKDADSLRQLQKDAAKMGQEGMAGLKDRFGRNADPKVHTALDETRRKITAEVDEVGKQADRAAAQGGFLSKLGTALQILDFVSVAAQGAAYLAEGDTTGAAGVMANEIAKKTAEGVGALVTSFVPGGPVFGSWAGNKVWEDNIKPVIDAREQALREAELRRAVLNKPWLVPKQFIDSTGRVRDLEADQYVERGSGLVRRRTPEEQAGFERSEYARWRDARTWEQIHKDHAEGKIDDDRLMELRISYGQRSLAEPWQPPGVAFLPPDEPDNADPTEEAPDVDDRIAGLTPVQVTATGAMTETFTDWGDISTTFEFAFWNLGTLSPQHGQAVLKITSSYEGSFVLLGQFSGGPNGTLTFVDEDGGNQTFRLRNGTELIAEVERLVNNGTEVEPITLTLPLSPPSAFDGWPDDLK